MEDEKITEVSAYFNLEARVQVWTTGYSTAECVEKAEKALNTAPCLKITVDSVVPESVSYREVS